MKGFFVVFEGIDGSGTSTQSKLLYDYLTSKGIRCHLTAEPSAGPIGTLIRHGMSGRTAFSKGKNPFLEQSDLFDEQMAYLFAADRHDHLYNSLDGVVGLVEDGVVVISSRYFFSSFAYHCSSKEEYEFVKELNSRFPNPDLVVYMDNEVNVSVERMSSRAVVDEYENKEKLEKVRNNYLNIFDNYDGELLKVDANSPVSDIHCDIVNKVLGAL
ncbi:dTMP kinase [Larsenimonas rhizosphaerae]|uniref:Thymidylate kinase n=1 Tax=Larsenimonas rhizosphaerae TaxID=2944682 RepID=A0AA41ZL35_9GAMM|nr:dTMP kinase [Larsenimonas rhizosphaerae]MCX2522735.1 dTMP kinase [Larsenimonas rhizosphaerae]